MGEWSSAPTAEHASLAGCPTTSCSRDSGAWRKCSSRAMRRAVCCCCRSSAV